VFKYTFKFEDRADPTYLRIYYYAIEANVSYAPTDANPADIISYILESDVFGAQFPDALIGDFSEYASYCRNNGLLLSVAYDSSIACTDIINELMECTNSEYVFSQGKLKLIPYWDNLPAQYAITGKDIFDQDEDTLLIERTSEADIYNVIPLEHLSRANDYNVNMVYASDEGNIELNGVKQAGTYTHHGIMTPQLAQAVAQVILQKQLYNRNKYTIRVGQEFILLEPMDTCTLELELAGLGLTTVRVVSIKENADDLSLDITFEDNFSGVATAPTYNVQPAERTTPETNADPGKINYPIIFELPHEFAKSVNKLDVWIYASGSMPYWGGCSVWASEDGNSYVRIGRISRGATEFQLITELLASPDPDTTHTPKVKMLSGELQSTTKSGADSFLTISCLDGEFIAYETATLVDVDTYELSYIRRGLYGSKITNHPAGSYGVRCNDVNISCNLSPNDIGKTYYLKFTSFNTFGTKEQDLSEVEPYEYTITGFGINYAPNSIDSSDIATYYTGNNMYLEWNKVSDERDIYYEIRKGDNWNNALIVGETTDTQYQITSSGTYWVVSAYKGTDGTYYSMPIRVSTIYLPVTEVVGSNEELGYEDAGTLTNTIIIR
jgi:hypothetical protein